MYTLILASCLLSGAYSLSQTLKTEYYETLILRRTAQSQVFISPTSNEEFRAGAESKVINDFGTYDFIIVGAGSSGSVLATRLSEDNFNVLLLEAGGEEDDFNKIPAMWRYLQRSEINWGYYTTSQNNSCLNKLDRKCPVPRGKVIGGCSSINAVMYVRGNAQDYNTWAELGNPGWAYEDVLPYFIKSENSQIEGDDGYHGKGGLWNVEYAKPSPKVFSAFINATKELGVSVLDYNGLQQNGSSQVQLNIKRGVRHSTGTAFLKGARKRKNLKVKTRALATRIIIDPETKAAQGVEFVTQNQKFKVTARKEVIISAGAINSPQLLMLSGIGPRDHLEELGITVLADLPVGKNLLDHPLFSLILHTNDIPIPNTLNQFIQQYLNGYGRLTKPAAVEGLGFLYTGDKPTKVPAVEYILFNHGLDENNLNPTSDFCIGLILLHEKSRGRITLKSSDPIDFPDIDLNMFAEQEDIDNLIEGIEFIVNLTKTTSFQDMETILVNPPICVQFTMYSHQYWECAIRLMAETIFHPCGTTAMGSNATTSVVDNNLKVHGIEHLRVVDAGVFPTTISGHTNAAAVMIAEKIADAIKKQYQSTPVQNIHNPFYNVHRHPPISNHLLHRGMLFARSYSRSRSLFIRLTRLLRKLLLRH